MKTPPSMALLLHGSQGVAVAVLQNVLNRLPTGIPRLSDDGIFGDKTKGRVLEFQNSHGLLADAKVGPFTWEAIVDKLVGTAPQRARIVELALNEAVPCDVFATVSIGKDPRDPRGRHLRMGHDKLLKYFRLAWPDAGVAGRNREEAVKYFAKDKEGRDQLNQLRPCPDWCGIFALWALKSAGCSVGDWKGGISRSGLKAVTFPLPGDIGYIDQPNQHHFVVQWVWPLIDDLAILTVEGNSGTQSSFSFRQYCLKGRYFSYKQVSSWYSAF